MKTLLIASCAAVLGLGGAALAQPMPATPAVPATPATPAIPATPATPDVPATPAAPATPATAATPAVPAASTDATAATGAQANASATAPARPSTSTYLGAGLQVRDSTGASVGRITHLTVNGSETTATIRMGSREVNVPVTSLHLDGQYAVSAQTKAELRALQSAPATVTGNTPH